MKFENNKQKRSYMISKSNERLGETNLNKLGSKMWIIRYGNARDIDVEFESGYIAKNKTYQLFKDGVIKSPYDISVFGHGYIGEGKYSVYDGEERSKAYVTWKSMLNRCYSSNYHKKQKSYRECEVCKEWLNFQNFARWFYDNYYEIGEYTMHLDKDILVKGNKVYSPDTCIFVPQFINKLFTKTNSKRGQFPIGVSKYKTKYKAYCNDGSKHQIWLGIFDTEEDAFHAYKKCKEKLIVDVANEYVTSIPKKLYNALINYKVNIED